MLQWWRGATLRTHLLVRLMGLFCLVGAIFVSVSTQAVNLSTQQALEERKVVAQLMAERIDAQFGHALAMLQSVVPDDNQNLTEDDLASIGSHLQGLFEHSVLFKRILLLDATGVARWTAPNPGRMLGANLFAPPYNIRLADASQPAFLQTVGFRTEEPGVAVMYPVHGRDSTIMGYVCGWIDLGDPRASSLLYAYAPGSEGYTDLVNQDGLVLASTHAEQVGAIGDHAGQFGLLIKSKAATVGACHSCHETQGAARQDDVLAFAPLTLVAWGLALRQPASEVFAATRSLTYQLGVLGLVVLAAFAGLAWATAGEIVNPLRILTKASRDIAGGDLSHPVSTTGVAETALLAGSFETMRQDLLRYREAMETGQQELEHRVQERTVELTQVRDYLLTTNRNLTALNGVSAILGQSLDLSETLNAALSRTLEAVEAERGGIYLIGPDDDLVLAVQQGMPPEALVHLSSLTAQEGHELADLTEEASATESVCRRLAAARLRYPSLLCVPLKAKGRSLGVLFVADGVDSRFTLEDRTLLSSIAWQIALTVRNARLYDDLQRVERSRANLLHGVIAAQEEERKRIARELHDETSQALTALMVGLDTASLALAVSPHEANDRLSASKAVAAGMLINIRRLTADLRPLLLDDLGLVPAIIWYGQQRLRPVGIELRLESHGLEERLAPDVETALFRIVQEALTNVIRHAQASTVTVTLTLRRDSLSLRVADNGHGFDPALLRSDDAGRIGQGLLGMQERVAILAGEFRVDSMVGRGTVIAVHLPVAAKRGDS